MKAKLSLLVTRPDPQGSQLCQLIKSQGHRAFHLPTIAFAPPPDPQAYEQAISLLGEQDWLIFISPQAVSASIPAIRRAWPNFPPQLKFAALGKGTAIALQEAGYIADTYPTSEWNSEGLLDLPEFQSVTLKKIAVIRGQGGRENIEKILTLRGATVISIIAYERILPMIDVHPYLVLLKKNQLDGIICTSFESVQNLKILLGAHWEYLQKIPLIVISDRIKALAHNLGFQTIWVAPRMEHKVILSIIDQQVRL